MKLSVPTHLRGLSGLTTEQLERLVRVMLGVLLLLLVSFGVYYYFDRYHSAEVPVERRMVAQAESDVRDNPESIDSRLALAESYMLSKRWEDAIGQALAIQQLDPREIRADFVLGISYASSGRWLEAIDPLQHYLDSQKDQDMLALNRSYLVGLYHLGESYLQLEQYEQAIGPLEAAVVLGQTDADALYKLALAYTGLQEYERAVVALQEAVRFVPNFQEAYQALATVYQASDHLTEAEYARAMVDYAKGHHAEARKVLLRITDLYPSFGPAFVGLGLACEAQGDLPCALDAFRAAYHLLPDDFTADQGARRVEAALRK